VIELNEVWNSKQIKVVRVYMLDLANQLKRKGFDIIGTLGDDGIKKPTQYTLYGDIRRITNREKPYIEYFGQLKQKKESYYGQTQRH
jgi:hypothetical protein